MKFNQALDKTLSEHNINAKALGEKVGVNAQSISDYRRGRRDMGAEKLKLVVDGLPIEAQRDFYKLAGVPRDLVSGDIWEQIESMNVEQLSQLVIAIATRFPEVSKAKQLQKV